MALSNRRENRFVRHPFPTLLKSEDRFVTFELVSVFVIALYGCDHTYSVFSLLHTKV